MHSSVSKYSIIYYKHKNNQVLLNQHAQTSQLTENNKVVTGHLR